MKCHRLSRIRYVRHPQLFAVLVAAAAALPVVAQPLASVESKAPYPREYALYEDKSQTKTYLYAPLLVDFELDLQTNKPRIGVQYFTDPDSKTIKLAFTATLHFVFDRKKVEEIAAWAKKQKGQQAKLGMMSGISGECGAFVVRPGSELVMGETTKSNLTFDSTISISGSFDFDSREAIGKVLQDNGTIGASCRIEHRPVTEASKDVMIPVEVLTKFLANSEFTGIEDGLEPIASQLIEEQSVVIPSAMRPFARSSVMEWIDIVASKPKPKETLGGSMKWGWDLSKDDAISRVKQHGNLRIVNIEAVAYKPVRYSVAAIDDMCESLPKHILDLDSGAGGCDDLK